MALLGWNPNVKDAAGAEREIFSKAELVSLFDLTNIHKGGAIFSDEKLMWMNKVYLAQLSDAEFIERAAGFIMPGLDMSTPKNKKLLALIREKIQTLAEIKTLFMPDGELSFASKAGVPEYKKEALMWRQEKDIAQTKAHLKYVIDTVTTLSGAPEEFTLEKIKAAQASDKKGNK